MNKIDNKYSKQTELVLRSYDKGIDCGRQGIDLYDNLPKSITDHPSYQLFMRLKKSGSLSDSGRKEIKEFLAPMQKMKFIDLGCCLNLMFNQYDLWPSTYYGVDISPKTIQLLNEFVQKKNIIVGNLHCCSIHKTPFDDNYFQIAACIGILEYFEKDFVCEAIIEAHRIIQPNGKFVLDIPNFESPIFEITKLIEEYLGRPDKFNMAINEFENQVKEYFIIEKKEDVAGMTQYFLVSK